MSFLAPLFLLGAAALVLPILFHLARRTPRERLRFGSLMFLAPTTPRLTKRSRLEHWLLLLLRCLALALLAFGFARPFLKEGGSENPSTQALRRQVILLDRSASLRRDGLWADALARVEAEVKAAAPGDRLAVIAFARGTETLLSLGEWETLPAADRPVIVRERLERASPSWEGTRLGQALVAAAEMLTEDADTSAEPGVREIVLISDLQAGSRLDALQAFEWPAEVTVRLEPVVARTAGNAGVQVFASTGETESVDVAPQRVRVTNAADSVAERFSVGWGDRTGQIRTEGTVEAYVPPGQSRMVTLPKRPEGQPEIDRVVLKGDASEFDNTAWTAETERRSIRVLYLGGEAAGDARQPRYFLERALPATARWQFELVARDPAALKSTDVTEAAVVVLTDTLEETGGQWLRREIEAGKSLLAAPKSLEAARSLVAWLGAPADAVQEHQGSRYAMWGEIDFTHPVFAPFSDPRFGDFTKIHVWAHRMLDAATLPGSRVVAKFDSGAPALVQVPIGKGNVWILTSGWHPADSQLGVSSKFVPLLWSLLEQTGVVRAEATTLLVGDPIDLDPGWGVTEVIAPNGTRVPLATESRQFTTTTEPGIYRLQGAGGGTRVVVGLDPAETRTEPLAADELEQRGVRLRPDGPSSTLLAKETSRPAVETEGRQKLWRWFLWATLLVVGFETLLAGLTARRAAESGGIRP